MHASHPSLCCDHQYLSHHLCIHLLVLIYIPLHFHCLLFEMSGVHKVVLSSQSSESHLIQRQIQIIGFIAALSTIG